MSIIYHITSSDAWRHAQSAGEYRAPSLESEHFIHCSTAEQVVKVANAFYRGQTNLVLLCIETNRLQSEVKWEAPFHTDPNNPPPTMQTELFPHIYGSISLTSVIRVVDFAPNADGLFTLPSERSAQ